VAGAVLVLTDCIVADCIVDIAVAAAAAAESMCAAYYQNNGIDCCLAVAAGNYIDYGPDAVVNNVYFHCDCDPGSVGELVANAL